MDIKDIEELTSLAWKLHGKDIQNFVLNGGVRTAILNHCIGNKKDTRWKDFLNSYSNGAEPTKEVKEMVWY